MNSVTSSLSSTKKGVINKLFCSSSKLPTAGNIRKGPFFAELVQERNFLLICRILADPATPQEWLLYDVEEYATMAPTPLHLLCLYRPYPAVVKATLEALWPCDLQLDAQGRTPLHTAILHGVRADVVQLLLGSEFSSAAAVPDSVQLRYPLHYACCCSTTSGKKSKFRFATAAADNLVLTVQLLISAYPEAVRHVDREGKKPIDLARDNRLIDPRIISILEYVSQSLTYTKSNNQNALSKPHRQRQQDPQMFSSSSNANNESATSSNTVLRVAPLISLTVA